MDEISKFKILKKVDFLSSTSKPFLEKFFHKAKDVYLKADEVLFEEGAPGDSMFIILSGQLAVYKKDILIAKRGACEYFGEMALIESKPRSATIEAMADSHLLEIRLTQFNALLTSNPKSMYSLLKTLSKRSRENLEILRLRKPGPRAPKRQSEMFGIINKAGLSKRQEDVVMMVCSGISDKETAKRLSLSPHTVRDHLKKIFLKLGVHSRAEMIVLLSRADRRTPDSRTQIT